MKGKIKREIINNESSCKSCGKKGDLVKVEIIEKTIFFCSNCLMKLILALPK
jgi:hypothetical protein